MVGMAGSKVDVVTRERVYSAWAIPRNASHSWFTPRCRFRSVTHHAHKSQSNIANVLLRGSRFLKQWMDHLEENADLRYPNLADVYVDA